MLEVQAYEEWVDVVELKLGRSTSKHMTMSGKLLPQSCKGSNTK